MSRKLHWAHAIRILNIIMNFLIGSSSMRPVFLATDYGKFLPISHFLMNKFVVGMHLKRFAQVQ